MPQQQRRQWTYIEWTGLLLVEELVDEEGE